jgi:hypothetical protein
MTVESTIKKLADNVSTERPRNSRHGSIIPSPGRERIRNDMCGW